MKKQVLKRERDYIWLHRIKDPSANGIQNWCQSGQGFIQLLVARQHTVSAITTTRDQSVHSPKF